jgi:hypothetical protein
MRSYSIAAGVLAATLAVAGCGDSMGPDDTGSASLVVQGRTLQQVDRFGLPAIATVFIPTNMKDAYNQGAPADDPAQFTDEVVATLMAFGYAADAAAGLAAVLLPDVQPIDLTQPTAFLNGRKLPDDVITAELGIIFGSNAALNDDHVDANDRPFGATFPYLAAPHGS